MGRAADGTEIDGHAQPLTVENLALPVRRSVEEAVRARSRALEHLSVRQGYAAVILLLALGAFGTLSSAWICVHAVANDLAPEVSGETLLLFSLSALAAPVVALLGYAVLRLVHYRALRSGRGLVGLGFGGTVLAIFWLATLLVYQPWGFPGPARTEVVPLASVESTVGGGHYRVLTDGPLSTGTLSSAPAVFVELPDGRWEAATLPHPVPLLLSLALASARTVPISAFSESLGGAQLGALRQRDELLGVLLGIAALAGAVLFVIQRSRWRQAPLVPVSERELRRLVDRIQERGTVPIEWSVGEDRLV